MSHAVPVGSQEVTATFNFISECNVILYVTEEYAAACALYVIF
jgi:hypothetical protein